MCAKKNQLGQLVKTMSCKGKNVHKLIVYEFVMFPVNEEYLTQQFQEICIQI